MQPRNHRRVRMRLPVRLRWSTPLGQKIELSKTLDASRGGLLLSTKEQHSEGAPLWVTFPYDASLADGQPEVPARVVRCSEMLEIIRAENLRENVPTQASRERERNAKMEQLTRALGISDAPATFAVALRFEEQRHQASNGDREQENPERRSSSRRLLAIPVRVRPEHVPWFEQAMTLDFSSTGMRFRSHREYAPGDILKISLEQEAATPWSGSGEFRARVVRVLSSSGSDTLDVGVHRE
jgi:PilZ domain-containing protein